MSKIYKIIAILEFLLLEWRNLSVEFAIWGILYKSGKMGPESSQSGLFRWDGRITKHKPDLTTFLLHGINWNLPWLNGARSSTKSTRLLSEMIIRENEFDRTPHWMSKCCQWSTNLIFTQINLEYYSVELSSPRYFI